MILIQASVLGIAAACHAQPSALPPAPAGVEVFQRGGIEFSRVRATNVPEFNPPNSNYGGPFGGGDWDFGIARTELQNSEWIEFMNAFSHVAIPPDQPWSSVLERQLAGWGIGIGVTRIGTGEAGRPIWAVDDWGAVRPIRNPGWFGSALFCNWLHNDKSVSLESILTGGYDLRQFDGSNAVTWAGIPRAPDARFWIPTYDEWAVASFYSPDPGGAGPGRWWTHLNMGDAPSIPGPPGIGETSAGWEAFPDFLVLPVAAYSDSQSPWGLFDTSGGVYEWLENEVPSSYLRMLTGSLAGSYLAPGVTVTEQAGWVWDGSPQGQPGISLRIATRVVPAPMTGAMLGLAVFARVRRRSAF